jgi:uncharacterized protein
MAFMMLLRRPPLLATVIVSSMLAGCLAVSVVLAPKPVTLATGTPGGIYFPVGNAICRMFNLPSENLPKPCVAVPTDGSVANIGRVERGESAFGLSQTDIAYAAVHGEGPFAAAGAAPKLRLLLALYPETFTAVARADTHIRDFEDLRGKRIGIGKSGTGYTYTLGVLLESFGWVIRDSERVQEFDPAEQNEALCDNKVDAIIFVTGHPNGLTQEATTRCRAKLVRVGGPLVERLLATAHPYYTASVIPGGMYARQPRRRPDHQAHWPCSSRQVDQSGRARLSRGQGGVRQPRRLPALAPGAGDARRSRTWCPSEAVDTDPSRSAQVLS